MNDSAQAAKTRRVRPWIAALLTFLGWGLGFYYARRTRAAILWAFAPAVLGLLLGAGVLWYALHADSAPGFVSDLQPWMLDIASLGLTALVAAFAWIVATRHREVQRASPARLFGYLAIWLAPMLLVLAPLSVRFFHMQPFRIPSGSMEPTLHVGDFILVSKSAYGYGPYSTAPLVGLIARDPNETRLPQRGDVVVFRPPSEPDRDFVMRVVGLPGDQIRMMDGVLHINGAAVGMEPLGAVELAQEWSGTQRVQAFRETLPNGVSYTVFDTSTSELDNTREYAVPPNHYFMMGDHRDNSADSRVYVGFVPVANIVGRVDRVIRVADQGVS